MRKGRRPKWMIKIGKERIDILFHLAEQEFVKNPERSHRYVKLAQNISTKYNIKMPDKWKHRFCKKCNKFLKPGRNCKVRTSKGEVHFKCLECGQMMRLPYNKEKKEKRRIKIESYLIQKRANE
ncbi:ribonuclease P protein component 4 [Methanobacterium alcaliphilum]|uniref:ribonuclease P protein component 4 n=1 Tax=Methanobacterium alcaliphilum TaxID=392018 RepID=UPI00200B89A0|nr:ribonuclease P protein component 4 [Methanobacterium alcaliphilum]MCK9152450.1 ribonuclease P [Methanobacterium alcaliphilum]